MTDTGHGPATYFPSIEAKIRPNDQPMEGAYAGVRDDLPQGSGRVAQATARVRARSRHRHHRASSDGKDSKAERARIGLSGCVRDPVTAHHPRIGQIVP